MTYLIRRFERWLHLEQKEFPYYGSSLDNILINKTYY